MDYISYIIHYISSLILYKHNAYHHIRFKMAPDVPKYRLSNPQEQMSPIHVVMDSHSLDHPQSLVKITGHGVPVYLHVKPMKVTWGMLRNDDRKFHRH